MKWMRQLGTIIIGIMLVGWGLTSEPVSYEAKAASATSPLKINGALDEADWSKAPVYTLGNYTSGAATKEKTEFRILYDHQNIYLGITCYESRIEKTVANATIDNMAAYNDDCIEIFISPAEVATVDNLYHFVGNINGIRYSDCQANTGVVVNWVIKTQKYKDKWTAEVSIPLSELAKPMSNEKWWRVNVTRNATPSKELSSFSKTAGSFLDPVYLGKLTGIDFDGKFITYKKDVHPLPVILEAKATQNLAAAQAYKPSPIQIIPEPVKCEWQAGTFVLNKQTQIVLANSDKADNIVSEDLNEEIQRLAGFTLQVLQEADVKSVKNCIVIGEPENNSVVARLLEENNLTVSPKEPGPEGYILKVMPNVVLIAGSDQRGSLYGVQSFKQLLRKAEKGTLTAPAVQVWDKPFFAYRGIHFLVDTTSPVVHAKMLKRIFARYKVNNLLIEVEKGIAWKTAPNLKSPFSVKPEDIKPLIELAKRYHMEVMPEVQTLGHGCLFNNGQNVDIAENSDNPKIYCPLNPESREVLYPILDECIELFGDLKYFHVGMDEHDYFQPFPTHETCKAIGNEKLYFAEAIQFYNFLKARGIRMVMWGDILQKPSFQPYIKYLPKDIVIADWNYKEWKDYPTIDLYRGNGLDVIGCSWYRLDNMNYFTKYCADRGVEGMMYTTWAGWTGFDKIMEKELKQVMGYVVQSDLGWNPNNRASVKNSGNKKSEPAYVLPYYPAKVLREVWYDEPQWKTPSKSGFTVNLPVNISLTDDGQSGFLGYGKGIDLSGLPSGNAVHLLDDRYYQLSGKGLLLKGSGLTRNFPATVKGIKVNRKASELNFLHTCLFSVPVNRKVGVYRVNYADGTSATIELKYGQTIYGWLDMDTYCSGNVAAYGVCEGNIPWWINACKWVNPYPGKVISTIDVESSPTEASPMLFAITGVNP